MKKKGGARPIRPPEWTSSGTSVVKEPGSRGFPSAERASRSEEHGSPGRSGPPVPRNAPSIPRNRPPAPRNGGPFHGAAGSFRGADRPLQKTEGPNSGPRFRPSSPLQRTRPGASDKKEAAA